MKNLLFVIVLFAILLGTISAHAQETTTTPEEKSVSLFQRFPVYMATTPVSSGEWMVSRTISMFDTNGDGKLEIVCADRDPEYYRGIFACPLIKTDVTITIEDLTGKEISSDTTTIKAEDGDMNGAFVVSRVSEGQFQCDLVIVIDKKKVIVKPLFRGEKKS